MSDVSKSHYDGYAFKLWLLNYAGILLTAVTLGICYPFYVCWSRGYEINHTVIDGRRLKFTGSAGSLFGSWIFRWLLIIVTLGIYKIWVPLKIEKWCAENTVFEDDANENLTGCFDSAFVPYFKVYFLYGLLSAVTLGMLLPFSMKQIMKYVQEHKVYGGNRLKFDGTGAQFYGTFILGGILSCITFGIYSIWFGNLIRKLVVKHTHFSSENFISKNRFCVKCGKEIPDGVEFCTSCGTPIGKSVLNVSNVKSETGPKKISKVGVAGIIVAAVVVILAGVFLIIGITSNDDEAKADNTTDNNIVEKQASAENKKKAKSSKKKNVSDEDAILSAVEEYCDKFEKLLDGIQDGKWDAEQIVSFAEELSEKYETEINEFYNSSIWSSCSYEQHMKHESLEYRIDSLVQRSEKIFDDDSESDDYTYEDFDDYDLDDYDFDF